MSNPESILNSPVFTDQSVNKVNVFTGNDMTVDTYYFKPNQVLDYHAHPNGDQCFYFFKGNGKFYLNNGSESSIDVASGSIVYVPAGVSHKIENSNTEMVAVQSTKAGA
jgi:quercetin dioxygenase-like cupin family protein